MPVILLTPNFVKNELICPSTKNRIEYCDTFFPGLYVEVRSTSPGQGTYYLRYKDPSRKTCHQKLGRTHEITVGQARQKAKVLKAEIILGSDPRADAKAQKAVIGFKDFSNEHYIPYVEQRKRSWRNDESMLRLRIVPAFDDTPLNRITRQQIQNFHTALREEGLSGASCDHHVKLMRSMLNLAIQWDFITKNPADKIPLFMEDNKLERYMTDEEQARLLEVLNTESNRTVSLLILFLLSTGARLNEALKSTWNNIDEEKCLWIIPAANSKSKKARSVPLNQKALEVLSQLPKRDSVSFLFFNRSTGKRYVNINKTWDRLRTQAGLPKLRLHDLRHQFASHLVNSGRSLYEVQQILGHSDPTVTQRYAHLSTRTLQEASETAAQCLGDALPSAAHR